MTGFRSMWTMSFAILVILVSVPSPAGETELNVQFSPPRICETGSGYVRVEMEGSNLMAPAGAPRLPLKPLVLLLPPGEELSRIEVISGDPVPLEGVWNVEPAQQPQPFTRGPVEPTPPDPLIYRSDVFYPTALHSEGHTARYRGFSIATLTLNPVRYRPALGALSYYPRMRVIVRSRSTETGRTAVSNFLSLDRETLSTVEDMVDNPEAISSYLHLEGRARPSVGGCVSTNGAAGPIGGSTDLDYLIITSSELAETFQQLADFKTPRGIRTEVVTLDRVFDEFTQGDDQNRIRDFIIDAYTNQGTRYILLGGDTEVVPHRGMLAYAPPFIQDADCPADIYYAGLDGTWNDDGDQYWGEHPEADYLTEVHLGRAPVDSVEEAVNFVGKVISYQGSPVIEDCTRALMVTTESYWNVESREYKEEIRLGSDLWGFSTAGIPAWFQTDTLYDADGIWDPYTDLIPLLNEGPNLINHVGHTNSYIMLKLESYMLNDQVYLNDGVGDGFSIIYSQGCFAGAFDNAYDTGDLFGGYDYLSEDAMAEQLVTMEHGAVACVMNSRLGWGNSDTTDGPSQYFDRQFFDALFGEGMNRLGPVFDDSKFDNFWTLSASETAPYFRYCYYTLNLLGDPEMEVWTEEPTALTVTHPEEVAMGGALVQVDVARDGVPVEGARVCLFQEGETGAYVRGDSGPEGSASLTVHCANVNPLTVSVTAANGFRYLGTITPRTIGAWIGYNDHEVDDDLQGSSFGDGDGLPNNGETIELSVSLRNFGTMQTAQDVEAVLSSDDPCLTVLGSWAEYGTLEPGESGLPAEPFVITITGDAPHGEQPLLELLVSDGYGNEWVTAFTPPLTCPAVTYDGHTVDDGGNCLLEPGEEADVLIAVTNVGGRPVHDLQATVASSDPVVEVLAPAILFGDMEPGSSVTALSPCRIRISPDAGTPCTPQLHLAFQGDWEYSGTDSFTAQVVSMGLSEDMESGEGAWAHGPHKWTADDWHLTPQYSAGGQGWGWKCGPQLSWGPYTTRMDAELVTPAFGLEPYSVLRFWHAIDAEKLGETDTTALDGGIVEITTDGGNTWEAIRPFEGYDNSIFPFWSPAAFATWTPCFSGKNRGSYSAYYLDNRQGVSRVRFRFGTDMFDGERVYRGWFVDDVSVAPCQDVVAKMDRACGHLVPHGEQVAAEILLANHTDQSVTARVMIFMAEEPYQGGPLVWFQDPQRVTVHPGQVYRDQVEWVVPPEFPFGYRRLYFRFGASPGGTPIAADSLFVCIAGF